ncbi:interleukin-27 subunit beta-like [Gastrophryne carolinensis]
MRLGLKGVEPPGQCVQIAHNPNSCLIMDYEMFSEHPYLVNVTVVNQLGSVTKLHHFFVEDIIRPDPPVNVSLSPVHGDSRKLLLQWSPPPSWPHLDYFPLSYLIRYKRNKAQAYRTVGPYEQTSFLLSGLRGGSMVHVQVAAQDFTGLGHHSDWSPVVSAHPWRKA